MKKKIIGILIAVALLGVGLFQAIPVLADVANPLDHVVITPGNTTLAAGGTQQFTAQAYDANGNTISNTNYFWLVVGEGGTINTTGLFTAGSVPSTYSNTVEVVAVQSSITKIANATVTVSGTAGALDHIVITPASATVKTSGTKQFTARGYDSSNIAITGLTYTWSITGGVGTITNTGLFTAGTTTGTFNNAIQASVTQGTTIITGMATVVITTNSAQTTTQPKLNTNKLVTMFKGYLNSFGFDNFLGGQWQVKNGTGIDTVKIIPGLVQSASATSLVIIPNGQTATSTYTLTTSTIIQPKNTSLVANDKVVMVTVNDQVTVVVKIITPSTTEQTPGFKHENKWNWRGIPRGWSHGNKVGWGDNSSNNSNQGESNNS